jgi:tape measure domain-containing protein
MPSAKDLQLDIQITGNESNLAKAIGLSERDLKKLGDAVNTVNRAIGKESTAAFKALTDSTSQASKGFSQVSSGAQKTAREVEHADESFRAFKATVAGVFTGEAIFEGIREGIHLATEGLEKMVDLFKEASMQAGQMELKVRGLGNLFRSQAFAQGLTQQLQQVAYASPFQLVDLMEAAQRLSGFGIKKEDLLETIKDLGNIVAGTGGGKPEMDRAALAYGEAITSQTLTTREINQLTQLGVPVWEALEKLTGKTNQELHKMIEKHLLSSSYITRVIEDLTHGDGLFADAMVHFSETFVGLLTTFEDKVGLAMRDMGDFFNVFTAEFLKFIDNSPLWEALHNWFVQLKDRAQAILTYLPNMFERMDLMPKMQAIGEKLGAAVRKLFGGFDINEMFTQVMIPSTGNLEEVLTAKGNAWVDSMKKFIDPLINLIDEIVTLAGNPMVLYNMQSVEMAMSDTVKLTTELTSYLDDLGKVMHGIITMNWGEVGQGMTKFREDYSKYGLELSKLPNTPEGSGEASKAASLAADRFWKAEDKLEADRLAGVTQEQIDKDKAELEEARKAMEAARKNTEAVTQSSAANITAAQSLITMTSAVTATTQALQQLSQMPGAFGGAFSGLSGLSDLTDASGGLAVREEYDWEGRSSQYGPKGNRLLTGNYVGLNPQEMAKYHVKYGDYVLTEAGWMKIQETASRPGTIEFHADRPGQFQNKASHLHILGTRPGASSERSANLERQLASNRREESSPNVNINYNPTIHHTGDASHFASLLSDHAQHISNMVSQTMQSHWERTAAV